MKCRWPYYNLHIQLLVELVLKIGVLGLVRGHPEYIADPEDWGPGPSLPTNMVTQAIQ